MSDLSRKNRRTGWLLAFIALGISLYSLAVIRTRGRLPVAASETRAQRLWRGL